MKLTALLMFLMILPLTLEAATNLSPFSVTFQRQEWPYCEDKAVWMEMPEGDYTNLSFTFVYTNVHPSTIRFMFKSKEGRTWHKSLPRDLTTNQTRYNIDLYSGWLTPPWQTQAQLEQDLDEKEYIGFFLRRHSDIKEQNFIMTDIALDEHTLLAPEWVQRYFPSNTLSDVELAELDADSDGLSNYQEFLAGTDPTDALSTLRFTVGVRKPRHL